MNIFWDAEKYKKDFSFVPQYGEAVMDLLDAAPGSRVIDLGCGNGALTEQLAARGYDVTGVDASAEMLELARENNMVLLETDHSMYHTVGELYSAGLLPIY